MAGNRRTHHGPTGQSAYMNTRGRISRRRFLQTAGAVAALATITKGGMGMQDAHKSSYYSSHEGVKISDPIEYGGGVVSRATLAPDGTIYLHNNKKSIDAGRTVVDCEPTDPKLSDILSIHRSFLNTHKHSQNRKRFLAIDYPLRELDPPEPNKFITTRWYSEDAFDSPVRVGTAIFHIPAGKVKFGTIGMAGLYVHRGIFELDDGSLLCCCFGNFETDTVKPPAGADIGIQARCFLVKSVDGGKNWHYLSSIAVPDPNIIKTQEGYDEASLAVLDDGRYLVVMRTGHWTPLVASYSADGGLTWTEPDQLPGLRNGVDPCLIKLRDGRLALAYGRNVKGGRARELAISEDGAGESWDVIVVSPAKGGNAYPTIFEVEPNVIFYQASSECWRVTLKPRN